MVVRYFSADGVVLDVDLGVHDLRIMENAKGVQHLVRRHSLVNLRRQHQLLATNTALWRLLVNVMSRMVSKKTVDFSL
jgi:hypothetical protein